MSPLAFVNIFAQKMFITIVYEICVFWNIDLFL